MNNTEFDALVAAVLADLPGWVREALEQLTVLVEDEPGAEIPGGDRDLLGIYIGTPLTERDATFAGQLPDVIYIYRGPHLELGLPPDALREEIARTVLHEVAHYFGLDDDYLEREGWG